MRAFLLVLALLLVPAAALANLRIYNAGSHSIEYVYFRYPQGQWSDDFLGWDEVIYPGYNRNFNLDSCWYDIRLQWSDGYFTTWSDFNTCANDLRTTY